jgi:hypothetical protein
MADEDIVPIVQALRNPAAPNFEEVLETLIVIAQGRGRNFLAYLLIMALMHARDEDLGQVDLHH